MAGEAPGGLGDERLSTFEASAGRIPPARGTLTVFERAFKDFGLPDAIRTDNGVPLASANALYGLSKLSCGGDASASSSSASRRAIRSKTGDTSACISPGSGGKAHR